jgi:hypothetical protein
LPVRNKPRRLQSGSVQEIELKAEQVNWKKELEPFRALSIINKPIYRAAYTISISRDLKSNLTIKAWTTTQDIPLKALRIYYLNTPDQIRKLEASIQDENFVFTSHRNVQLDFSVLGRPVQLQHYQISGSQKFFWGDQHSFTLEGLIQFK